jgi:type I restriction enzyme R subunit
VKAFEPYYRTAQLSGATDRNLPHQLRAKLDDVGVYLWSEVEAFAKLYFSTRNDQAFQAQLKSAHERFKALREEEREAFRANARSYVNAYEFLSQIVEYDDPELEKLHAFLKCLLPRLRGSDEEPIDWDSILRLAHYKLVNKREYAIDLERGEPGSISPFGPGGGTVRDDPLLKLSEILKKIHSIFTGMHSDAEVEGWFTAVVGNTIADERIQEQATANASADQFADGDFRAVLADAVVKALGSHHSMSEQMLQNPKVFDEVAETLLPEIYAKARAVAMQRGAMATG